MTDPILAQLVAEAAADPDTQGLLLHGSRSRGLARDDSDYDVLRIVTDQARAARAAAETLLELRTLPDGTRLDILYQSPGRLAEIAANPAWWTATYLHARVLLDKTGAITAAVDAIRSRAGVRARELIDDHYDEYLTFFVRSLKAWRGGRPLGARLAAAQSARCLITLLFAAQDRWEPYLDHMDLDLPELEAAQGWLAGFLVDALERLLTVGDPTFQQQLQRQVAAFLDSRDINVPHLENLPQVTSWTFD
jgi:hypothetical protein